jgi:hypothetical protein
LSTRSDTACLQTVQPNSTCSSYQNKQIAAQNYHSTLHCTALLPPAAPIKPVALARV